MALSFFVNYFLLPLLFASFILSTSDFSRVPYENDIDWEVWDDQVDQQMSLRQGLSANQHCHCGAGMSRLNVSLNTKIIGGVTSRNHAWPWAAAIVNVNATPRQVTCGASLISPQYLLTAAHCLIVMKQVGVKNFRIYLGGNRIQGKNITDRVIMSINGIKIHPAFSKNTLDSDIGLIWMTSPVQLTKNINPVCLSQGGSPFVGKDSIVTGWGNTNFGANSTSNSLREAHLKIISNGECAASYSNLSPNTICAKNTKKDFCNGDSGSGQVVLRSENSTTQIYTQVGIVSFNMNCSGSAPSVFTRVKNYLSFIKFNLRNATFCSDTFA